MRNFSKYELTKYADMLDALEKLSDKVKLIGSPGLVTVLSKRSLMNDCIEQFCSLPQVKEIEKLYGEKVSAAKYVNFNYTAETYSQLKKELDSLKFPLIVKIEGEVEELGHFISIVGSQVNLKEFLDGLIEKFQIKEISVAFQEFKNHSGCLFKYYILGEKTFDFSRKSIPDIEENQELVTFKTEQLEKLNLDGKYEEIQQNRDFLNKVVIQLTRELHCDLIGVDFIYSEQEKTYYLIDVNFFPGFKEVVGDFPTLLKEYLIEKDNY